MFRNTFPMRDNCTRGVQENAAIRFVVLQSADIL